MHINLTSVTLLRLVIGRNLVIGLLVWSLRAQDPSNLFFWSQVPFGSLACVSALSLTFPSLIFTSD